VRGCFHAQKEGYEGAGGGWRSYCDHSGAATVTNGALNLTPYTQALPVLRTSPVRGAVEVPGGRGGRRRA